MRLGCGHIIPKTPVRAHFGQVHKGDTPEEKPREPENKQEEPDIDPWSKHQSASVVRNDASRNPYPPPEGQRSR